MPELRLLARGFLVSRLDSVRIDSAVRGGDSLTLTFGASGLKLRGPTEERLAPYGAPVEANGVRVMVPRRPGGTRGTLRLISRDDAIRRLIANLGVKPRPNTDVVDVVYTDPDPVLAERVVNRIVQVFQGVNASTAQQESQRRRKFLQEQLQHNDSILTRARAALSGFRGRNRAYSTKVKLSTEQAGLSGLDVRREELESDRRVFKELLARIESPSGGGDQLGGLMSAPGIATNPVVGALYTQLMGYQIARDSITAGRWGRTASSPQVQRLDTLISATQNRLRGAVRSVISSLDAKIASLDELRARSSSSFPELSSSEEEESRLEEEVESARTMVTQLRTEYEKARLAQEVEVGQVEIVDLGTVPRQALGVSLKRKVALGSLLGLALGVGLALLLDRMNTSIHRREQVDFLLNLPELAVIPQLATLRRSSLSRLAGTAGGKNGTKVIAGSAGRALITTSEVQSIGAEAYRVLRTSLLFSRGPERLCMILVTSPAPGDGKTTVAANLAACFAQQGMRVLLMDCDLRRGRLHSLFNAVREPGLTDVVLGRSMLEDAIRTTDTEGLFLLTTGRVLQLPAELLGSPSMRDLLQRLRLEYEVVVLDTAPVLAASDTAVLATEVDTSILVLRAGQTDVTQAQLAVRQLRSVGGEVIGAVLNDQDNVLKGYDGYNYGAYYAAPK
jgi:capsular exopolysaccharide synthesis family protein